MNHLTPERWQALQERRDDALLAHVQEGCELCDDFLAALPGLDGEVDRALLALAPRPPSSDELAWARFRRRQRAAPKFIRYAAAAAAVVIVGAGAWAMLPPTDPTKPDAGLKGRGTSHLELRAALKSRDGALTPVAEGARVPASAALVFQVRSGVTGLARLFVQRGDAEPIEFAQVGLIEGAQELETGDGAPRGENGERAPRGEKRLLGFSLEGERGPLQVWLVAAEAPTSAASALAAIRAGGGDDVSVAHLRVDVVQDDP